MIPMSRGFFQTVVRIPRESGDDPTNEGLKIATNKYSPRERG